MRLASYNIRKAKGRGGRRDPRRSLSVIASLEADLVAVQEADRRLGARPTALPVEMIAEETDYRPVVLGPKGVSIGWHGNAVLVRDGVEVEEVDRLDLPGLEPRGAVLLRLGGASELTVVAVHLGLTRGARRRQLAAVRHRLAAETGPVAILGDFNEWRFDRGLEPLTEGFSVHAPGPSFPARRPFASFDRIALSHDLQLTASGVVDHALARAASDHLPIWAEIAPAELAKAS